MWPAERRYSLCWRIYPLSAWTQTDKVIKPAFFKRQSADSDLFYQQVLKHLFLQQSDWATRAMWRCHLGALTKRRLFLFSLCWCRPAAPPASSLGKVERRFSRRSLSLSLTRSAFSLPFQLCKHCWPLPRPNSAVCLPDKFVLFIFSNLADQRGFVIHKDRFPDRSYRGLPSIRHWKAWRVAHWSFECFRGR